MPSGSRLAKLKQVRFRVIVELVAEARGRFDRDPASALFSRQADEVMRSGQP
jgi:hypothetical protein